MSELIDRQALLKNIDDHISRFPIVDATRMSASFVTGVYCARKMVTDARVENETMWHNVEDSIKEAGHYLMIDRSGNFLVEHFDEDELDTWDSFVYKNDVTAYIKIFIPDYIPRV